jgi:ABC-type uncharacterized transport system substrate-binding protein
MGNDWSSSTELVPRAKAVGLVANPNSPQTERVVHGLEQAARKGLQLRTVKADRRRD